MYFWETVPRPTENLRTTALVGRVFETPVLEHILWEEDIFNLKQLRRVAMSIMKVFYPTLGSQARRQLSERVIKWVNRIYIKIKTTGSRFTSFIEWLMFKLNDLKLTYFRNIIK